MACRISWSLLELTSPTRVLSAATALGVVDASKGDLRAAQINLRNARHAEDTRPLDAECACPACASYSRAYLHHLCRCGEILASMLLTWHNLQYYGDLMRDFVAAFHQTQARSDTATA